MIDILVGVNVSDPELYSQYRAGMTPILHAHGGSFGVDVHVAEVLKSPASPAFNRLFTIRFPTLERHDAFFSNPDYLAVRKRYFEPGVSGVVKLGTYDVLA